MASNIRSTDLIIVGRGSQSFKVAFSDVAESILGNVALPDLTSPEFQAGTTDERYLLLSGGTLTGPLTLAADPTEALHAATKQWVEAQLTSAAQLIDVLPDMDDPNQQVGTLDERYVNITGDTMRGDLELAGVPDGDNAAECAVPKSYIDTNISVLQAGISGNNRALSEEINRATKAEGELDAKIDAEIERATDAENALTDRIDNLKVGDLADVSAADPSNGQVLSFDAASGEYVAKTIALSSNLDYQGQCDLTESVISGEKGQLLVNVGTGDVDSSWGAAVTGPVPTAVGGELVAFNGSAWQYVGTVGGGLTYTSFSANNVDATTNSEGNLSYNSDTGAFTFTKVDLGSRVPVNIGSLDDLPA